MPYADLQRAPEYAERVSGSHLYVVIVNEDDPADVLVSGTSGLTPSENLESLPVEESGEDGPTEIVQGRFDGSLSIPGFWSPKFNDRAPTRQSFIGKRYTIMEMFGRNGPHGGTVLNVYVGCVINRVSAPFGARGLRTIDMGAMYITRYNGAEWAARTGS